jgi:hypothetical protein
MQQFRNAGFNQFWPDPYVFGHPGSSDPDPLVRGTDPDPSIIKQK